MKVKNMTSNNGNPVPNQFIITDDIGFTYFQSYDSVIVRKCSSRVELDQTFWDYSKTTSQYRNKFLGETTAQIKAKINSGEYILTDLNA